MIAGPASRVRLAGGKPVAGVIRELMAVDRHCSAMTEQALTF